jgi:predicted ATP-dependent endonuclease of OLD family
MEERSQGAKTFLSFLFTIGAEAKHGIIKNSILILDEPESHLHPSGVRYLLKELKRIADKDNQVIYATHSIFMIDRSNYDGHYIISKKNEISKIEPSCKDRKGFFMQEEVL